MDVEGAKSAPITVRDGGSADARFRAQALQNPGWLRRTKFALGFVFAELIIAGLLLLSASSPVYLIVGALCILSGLLAFAILTHRQPSDTYERRWSARPDRERTFTFDADGVEIDSTYASASIDWLAIDEMRDDGTILMFLRGGFGVTTLDTSDMPAADREALVAYATDWIAEANAQRPVTKDEAPG
jgi:hypothetical protein